MFRAICLCKKHKEINIYFKTTQGNAEAIKSGFYGYGVVIYDAS